ncbi:MAG: MarR family winged helix-turn-helix transcriptional regulator [Pseudomonadota bacterium]
MSERLEDLARDLHGAALRLLRQLRLADEPGGLSGAQLSALSVLAARGPMSVGELAAVEQVRPPSMTHVINQLEKRRFLTRRHDAGDGRRQILKVSRAGARAVESGRAQPIAALALALNRLSRRDREAIARTVRILDALELAD